jgi:hypothetical protein
MKTFKFLLAVFAVAVTSCKKTGPAEAVITVLDSINQPVQNARVILRQDSVTNPTTGIQADVYQEQYTGTTGETFFSFDNEAVLNIEVTKDTLFENDEYIRLEQNETVRKTVILD